MWKKPKGIGSMLVVVLTMVLIIGGGWFLLFPNGCQAATTVRVAFRENGGGKGTDGCMTKLGVSLKKGKKITMPELPEKTGYISLGWTTVKKGTEVEYQVGDTVTIKENTVFYAVRQKRTKCKVKFKNNKGTAGGTPYKELNSWVYQGDTFVLPEVPDLVGYTSLGWTTTKAGKEPLYLEGTEITVEEDIFFYAVRQKASYVTIAFYDQTGSTSDAYSALNKKATKGSEMVLPEVEPTPGYTFLGWSRSRGRETNPEYLAGATITMEQNLSLFAVMFPTAKEMDVTELPVGWQQLYRMIVFVGDSRFNRMKQTLNASFGLNPNLVNVEYVCAEGKGLSWLKNYGKDQLLSLLGYGVKPAAVIFNMGVNDLDNGSKYVAYMKSIEEELKAKNVKLFYMSINPVSHPLLERVAKNAGALYRTPKRVLDFNKLIRQNLCSGETDYTYIDMYSYLISTGFRYDGGGKDGRENLVEDGLHYCSKTYKRIFAKTISFLIGQS